MHKYITFKQIIIWNLTSLLEKILQFPKGFPNSFSLEYLTTYLVAKQLFNR